MKVCAVCLIPKPENSAHYHQRKSGYRRECISCRSASDKARYRGLSSYQRFAQRLERKYGLSCEDYLTLLDIQKRKCGICGTHDNERPLVVDHCHITMEVRGLLCNQCNTGIGLLRGDETTDHLAAAAAWCDKSEPNDAQRHLRTAPADEG